MNHKNTIKTCPKCGYSRIKSDIAPNWQCPKCHVVYDKVEQYNVKINKLNQQRENARVLGFAEWGLLILLHIGLYLLMTPLVNGLDEIALDMLKFLLYPVNGLIHMVMVPVAIVLLSVYLMFLMILPLITGITTSSLVSRSRAHYKSLSMFAFFPALIVFTWSNLWLNNTALLSGVIEAFLTTVFIFIYAQGKDKSINKRSKRENSNPYRQINAVNTKTTGARKRMDSNQSPYDQKSAHLKRIPYWIK